jgi:preprotein translocase subunit SecF
VNFNKYENLFSFVKHRNKFFVISILIIVAGIISYLVSGLNYGVDFKAGTTIDIMVNKSIDQAEAKAFIEKSSGLEAEPVVVGGDNSDRISARFDTVLDNTVTNKIKADAVATYGESVSMEVFTVSADIARELGQKTMIAVLVACVFIGLYVTIRFEWRFALAAIIAVLHDAFIVLAFFAIFQMKIDLPFIAAILTIIGYSINDKIVIFDRIRENQRFAKIRSEQDLIRMVDDSIWQTMSRNINTVIMVLIAAVCLFIFGGESIKLFALAKAIGLVSGAYSSVCIGTPLWFLFKKNTIAAKWQAAPAKE